MGLLDGTVQSGCGSGARWPANVAIQVRSGDNTTTPTPNPLGGYSCWFGDVSADATYNLPPLEQEAQLHLTSVDNGTPIIGVGFNVHPDSTVGNFTGHVLRLDYENENAELVYYNDQSLRDGSPTVVDQAAFTPGSIVYPVYFVVYNYPLSWTYGEFTIYYNDGGTQTLLDTVNTGLSIPSTDTIGQGFVWMGNPNLGLHEATFGAHWEAPHNSFFYFQGQS